MRPTGNWSPALALLDTDLVDLFPRPDLPPLGDAAAALGAIFQQVKKQPQQLRPRRYQARYLTSS